MFVCSVLLISSMVGVLLVNDGAKVQIVFEVAKFFCCGMGIFLYICRWKRIKNQELKIEN